jgi:glycosyltransferase involved in cell wall biosynthesis
MLISVITPTFNSEKFIKKNVNSLNIQKQNFEQIFVDNISTDSTQQIIKDNARYPYKIISEKDDGIYYAMNKGISKSIGDYILFLNSDDWLPEKTIENVLNEIKKNPNNDIYYGNSNYYKNNNEIFTQKSNIKNIFKTNSVSHQAMYYSKKIFISNMFDTFYQVAADYDLSIKLVKENYNFFHIDKILSNNLIGGYSSNLLKSFNDFFEIQKKNNGLLGYFNTIIEYKYKLLIILFKKIYAKISG